jgi:dipeptidyl aminopeptidase/acylaminoacyl peptidase
MHSARAEIAPYGSWKSPIGAEQIATATLRLGEVQLDGEAVYWSELRPAEAGRCVVVRRSPDGTTTDVIRPPFNARSRVHEYGGGAYVVSGGRVWFVNFDDQRLYVTDGREGPRPVAPAGQMRYADMIWDARRGRIICVREDHGGQGQPVNTIVAVDPNAGNAGLVLAGGNDFYAAPRLSADGGHLAWLTWNHPDMPWDAAELWVAPAGNDGSLGRATHVAGGEGESVAMPQWSPDGLLYFVSDRSNWWNLYRRREGRVELIAAMEGDFARPQWVFGQSTYAFVTPRRIICTFNERGIWHLASVDAESGRLSEIAVPFNDIRCVRAAGAKATFIAGSAADVDAVVQMNLETREIATLRRAGSMEIDAGYIATPEPVEFPTEGGLTAFGLLYRPTNRDFAPPQGAKPPLMVSTHGGPTSAASPSLSLTVQYFTSRGFAVLDVNYGGSTGYGREYRRRLEGGWGVVDVDDCCNGAKHLAGQGLVDGRRMAIRGGSAGGYTTLAALAFRDVFAAGASHFGVSDCEALARETHKFEAHYLDRLIGPYPQRRDLYVERSAAHHADGLSRPVIFFQGLDDRIVPPNQAEQMVAALRKKGVPVAYVAFAGEQHGFRRAESIRRALEAELYFLSRVFGFALAECIEPVEIENL